MEIDVRINAVRPKVAAPRKMISQLTPRNEDQEKKDSSRRESSRWRGFFQNPERLTGKMI
jgi:hypothetical protein